MRWVGRRGVLVAASLAGAFLLSIGLGAAGPNHRLSSVLARPIQPEVDQLGGDFAALAPHVVSFTPSGDNAPVEGAVVVTFSTPMAAASVEGAFSIRPATAGRLSWRNPFTIQFQPFLLAHGVDYEVRVGGLSDRGSPLRGERVWWLTTTAGPPLVLAPRAIFAKVPILTYHYIRINPSPTDRLGFALSVTPADFAAQMDWLAAHGFHTVTPIDVYDYLKGVRGLPSRPVILSFDDGYEDFYTAALPVLRAHDFTAVAYIVSGFIGWSGYMTADQIHELDLSGIEIGSHTVDHVNLARSAPANLHYQLVASKLALQRLLGRPVLSFCYPSGQFNGAVMAAVEAAGYDDATTTLYGYVHYLSDRYIWGRLRISGGEGLNAFATAVLGAS